MRSKFIHTIYFFAALIFSGVTVYAQDVQVTARIDSTSILIGNQTQLRLIAAYDVKNGEPKILWPNISDSIISKIEVISKSNIKTVIVDSNHPTVRQQIQDIIISGYDSGYYAIPPFSFVVNGDTGHPKLTEAMMLQVMTVHVDTSKAYKDIKGPMQVRFSWMDYLNYILLGLVGLVLIAVLIWFIVKSSKKKGAVVIIEKPKVIIPPHVKALEDLEKLSLKKLWQEGKIKEYYTGITDILREYLYGRYGISAQEMTSDEIMQALKRKDIDEAMKAKLREILVLADLVKFAKENPVPEDHQFCFNTSIDFVKETAPIIEKDSASKSAEVQDTQTNTLTT